MGIHMRTRPLRYLGIRFALSSACIGLPDVRGPLPSTCLRRLQQTFSMQRLLARLIHDGAFARLAGVA